MTETTDAPAPAEAVMGHNSGADAETLDAMLMQLPSVDALALALEAKNQDPLDRVEALLGKGVEFLIIENDAQDAEATEFLVKLRARYKASEADRVAAKSLFDDLAGSIQAFFQTKILGPLGSAPSSKTEEFDPVMATHWGMGVRITMAQTLYKRRKADKERREREAEAARLRQIEADAAADRARKKKEADDRIAAEAKAAKEKADAEAAERKRIADAAAAAAAEAAAAAARKRNADSRAVADAAAAAAAAQAEKVKAERETADRQALADQEERDRRTAADREEADRLEREEENRLAQQRAAAEDAAAATTADLSRARGGKGGVSSLREFVDFRDLKRDQLGVPLNMKGLPATGTDEDYPPSICLLLPFIKDAALESAIKEYAKANQQTVKDGIKNGRQPVHGVVYFMNSKSAGRS